jgi:malonate decarboxylase beta subunit
MSAGERAAALVDAGTIERFESPTDSTVWIGAGAIDGRHVLLALTDGHRRGGTVGIDDAAVLSLLTAAAGRQAPVPIVVCWDTGGVRVDEGPVALAATSAVGIALARLSFQGCQILTVISGPRGCFGAPSVVAALSDATIMTADSHWGLTGPKLLRAGAAPVDEAIGREVTSAAYRRRAAHTTAVVPDSAAAIRIGLERALRRGARHPALARVPALAAERVRRRLDNAARVPPAADRREQRERDLLRFSFRGHWLPTGPTVRRGLAHAAWGQLDGEPALGIVVGERTRRSGGVGIEEASAVTDAVRYAVQQSARRGRRAPILIFLFCQGHSVEVEQERRGLHRALAECVRGLVAARLLGHPLLCVLGGGAYGAAYLSLAAPSHRILAIRGTSVAPMAPAVLAAFRQLRGLRQAPETPADLAELIPDVRIVESIIRLPRVLREELDLAVQAAVSEALPRQTGARRRAS